MIDDILFIFAANRIIQAILPRKLKSNYHIEPKKKSRNKCSLEGLNQILGERSSTLCFCSS